MKRRKTAIPKQLGRVMLWLEREGFSVYGQSFDAKTGQLYRAHQDYSAAQIRAYIKHRDAGTLNEPDGDT